MDRASFYLITLICLPFYSGDTGADQSGKMFSGHLFKISGIVKCLILSLGSQISADKPGISNQSVFFPENTIVFANVNCVLPSQKVVRFLFNFERA